MTNTLFNQHQMDKYAKNKDFKLNLSKHELIQEHLSKLEKGELEAKKRIISIFMIIYYKEF